MCQTNVLAYSVKNDRYTQIGVKHYSYKCLNDFNIYEDSVYQDLTTMGNFLPQTPIRKKQAQLTEPAFILMDEDLTSYRTVQPVSFPVDCCHLFQTQLLS